MIITKTPFRMSFFGGGTDIPDFFLKYGGSVISTTIDKYCYVTVRKLPHFFDYSTELTYSRIERVSSIDEIKHPAIRNAMKMLEVDNLRVTYDADLPARTGLGSSSSFAVGMINAFHCLKGNYVSKRELADEAIRLERDLCNEAGGWQDQIAASFGGLNRIVFGPQGYKHYPIIISPQRKDELEKNLLLFFTGFTRISSEIHRAKNKNTKTSKLKEIASLTNIAEEILTNEAKEMHEIGELLDLGWKLKRGLSDSISTSEIDFFYNKAKEAGAIGGKLLGAGGGGFLLLYVDKKNQQNVIDALSNLLYVPFKFENDGTTVIHYAPETLHVDNRGLATE